MKLVDRVLLEREACSGVSIVTHGVTNYRLIVDNDIFPCTLFRVAVIVNVRKLTLTYVSKPNFAQLSN